MKDKKCPRCGSKNIKEEGDEMFSFLVCLNCGFDESMEYESDTGDRKGKSSGGSPYKRGGSLRIQKR
jgi:predicted nucleic-acid-binding Zn-ribbon protein